MSSPSCDTVPRKEATASGRVTGEGHAPCTVTPPVPMNTAETIEIEAPILSPVINEQEGCEPEPFIDFALVDSVLSQFFADGPDPLNLAALLKEISEFEG